MTHPSVRWLVASLMALAAPAWAATLIESQDGGGGSQKVWIDNHQMRIEAAGEPGFMLIDARKRAVYAVDTEERTAIDMSRLLTGGPSASPRTERVAPQLQLKGKGPTIAGYPTEHYELWADGRKCSDEYLSAKALADLGGTEALDAMSNFGGIAPEQIDPCAAAGMVLTETYKKAGFPLRSVDTTGFVESEVTRIVTNAGLPPGGFDVPAGFRVMTMDQAMQHAAPQHPHDNIAPAEIQRMLEEMMKQREQR